MYHTSNPSTSSASSTSAKMETPTSPDARASRSIFEINFGVFNSSQPADKDEQKSEEREHYEPIVKKTKLSEYEYMIVEKDCPNVKKIIVDVYSMLERDVRGHEESKIENKAVDNATLVSAFAKGIFRFTLHELSAIDCQEDADVVERLRLFSLKNFDKIKDLDGIKWIWTVDENDDYTAIACKMILADYSIKFFSDEKVILQWIEDPEIRRIIESVYSTNKTFLQEYLLLPRINSTLQRK